MCINSYNERITGVYVMIIIIYLPLCTSIYVQGRIITAIEYNIPISHDDDA